MSKLLYALIAVMLLVPMASAGYASLEEALAARAAEAQPYADELAQALTDVAQIPGSTSFKNVTVTPASLDAYTVVKTLSVTKSMGVMQIQIIKDTFVMNDIARHVLPQSAKLYVVYAAPDGTAIATASMITDQPFSPSVESFGGDYAAD